MTPLLYLDPGTGSLLLYALVGIVSSLLFALRRVWYALLGRFNLSSRQLDNFYEKEIVFHSEGGKYWSVFEPVIRALGERGTACLYVTPDESDPGLTLEQEGYRAVRPGGEMAVISFMNRIHAPLVISTTPHLDVYMLKRSPHVKQYVHLFHAPTDICFYEKYAFDWYDAILTVGPFQEESIRLLEKKRGTGKKALFPTGCTYFDFMLREAGSLENKEVEPVILYAPAWGVRSSVFTYGADLITGLAERGYRVIFRPHPQFYISHKDIISDMERELESYDTVEIDTNKTGTASIIRSSLMITDLSGVLFDYAFLYQKPIILMNSETDDGGQEGEDLPSPLWDVRASKELAALCFEGDISILPNKVDNILSRDDNQSRKIADFKKENIFNFGKAGEAAAEHLIALKDSIHESH